MPVLPRPWRCSAGRPAPDSVWVRISPRMYDSVNRFEPTTGSSSPAAATLQRAQERAAYARCERRRASSEISYEGHGRFSVWSPRRIDGHSASRCRLKRAHSLPSLRCLRRVASECVRCSRAFEARLIQAIHDISSQRSSSKTARSSGRTSSQRWRKWRRSRSSAPPKTRRAPCVAADVAERLRSGDRRHLPEERLRARRPEGRVALGPADQAGRAEQLRDARHAAQVPRARRRSGVRQVERDRCADPLLLPSRRRLHRQHRVQPALMGAGARVLDWISPFFSA